MKKSKSTETEAVLENPAVALNENETLAIDEAMSQFDSTEPGESREMTEVEKLTNKRTGFWELPLEEADMRWVKNQCNSKFSFVGPNEAFMLMNCYLGFSAALARHEQVVKAGGQPGPFVVQAIALEACALMINRFEGSGIESAQRTFRIAVALNNPISEMKKLDEQIESLKNSESES